MSSPGLGTRDTDELDEVSSGEDPSPELLPLAKGKCLGSTFPSGCQHAITLAESGVFAQWPMVSVCFAIISDRVTKNPT